MARTAVILAGGKGSRLAPYTTVLPKPLLPVGDRAILEVVLQRLAKAGIDDVVLAVGHLAHIVKAVLGDGAAHGLRIRYHVEDEALGTAGPLAQIDGLERTFLMMNGDVLTDLDHRALVAAHREAGNLLTIATHARSVEVDYGVLHTDDGRVVGYDEKPTLRYNVSMGVYAVEPAAIAHVPVGRQFDLPDLVQALLAAGEPVGAFPHAGYWLDIGRHDDYERAQRDAETAQP